LHDNTKIILKIRKRGKVIKNHMKNTAAIHSVSYDLLEAFKAMLKKNNEVIPYSPPPADIDFI